MSDIIRITGVQAVGRHGVLPEERTYDQPFIVDIEAELDARRAARSDDVADTISYADLANDAVSVVSGESVNLIETLAQRIADRVLQRGARRVEVTLHKPKAPVGIPFSDASVTIRRDGPLRDSRRGVRHVVLSLGSNEGDRAGNLRRAIDRIKALPVSLRMVSSYVETKAVTLPGQGPQPDFLNLVVILDTALAPLDLLAALQQIEVRGGRVRHERWGARTLDIDIVDFEGVTSSDPELLLPHPRAKERLFVLLPWYEVEPHATLGGAQISDLIEALRGTSDRAAQREGEPYEPGTRG